MSGRLSASKCECGHVLLRHYQRRVAWEDDYEAGHCLTCTCPRYKFLTKASVSEWTAGLRRYPRRERSAS